jgi:hypothetical protein
VAISVLELNVDLVGRADHERDLKSPYYKERHDQPRSIKVESDRKGSFGETHVLFSLSYTDDEHLSSESHRL